MLASLKSHLQSRLAAAFQETCRVLGGDRRDFPPALRLPTLTQLYIAETRDHRQGTQVGGRNHLDTHCLTEAASDLLVLRELRVSDYIQCRVYVYSTVQYSVQYTVHTTPPVCLKH